MVFLFSQVTLRLVSFTILIICAGLSGLLCSLVCHKVGHGSMTCCCVCCILLCVSIWVSLNVSRIIWDHTGCLHLVLLQVVIGSFLQAIQRSQLERRCYGRKFLSCLKLLSTIAAYTSGIVVTLLITSTLSQNDSNGAFEWFYVSFYSFVGIVEDKPRV